MAATKPFLRQSLSRPGLMTTVREVFDSLDDHRRQGGVEYPLGEVCSASLARFTLKMPSLLSFEQMVLDNSCIKHNLGTLFGVTKVPSDSQMRIILDPIDPARLRPAFRAIHSKVSAREKTYWPTLFLV